MRTRENIGVGMLGYAFMGKAHSRAFREAAVAAVRSSVLQWRFIDGVAGRIEDAALREAQQAKDALRAYELVYAALGAA